MRLKIDGVIYENWGDITLSLTFNTVASSFSFTARPQDKVGAENVRFARFQSAVIEHEGQTILTGTITNVKKRVTSKGTTINVQGYSTTGVLADCPIAKESYPLQFDNLSLRQIAEKVASPYDVEVVFSPTARAIGEQKYTTKAPAVSQRVSQFLAPLASQKGLILRHNELGQLLFTNPDPTDPVVATLQEGIRGVVELSLEVRGQGLYSETTAMGQASLESEGQREGSVENPAVTEGIFRPQIIPQTNGESTDSQKAARTAVSAQLENIVGDAIISGFRVGVEGKKRVAIPGDIVEVLEPRIDIDKKTRLLVLSNTIKETAKTRSSILELVMEQTYSDQTPVKFYR
jgi:prophage tail gpP-like protein